MRKCLLPDKFASVDAYATAQAGTIIETINLQIFERMEPFWKVLSSQPKQQGAAKFRPQLQGATALYSSCRQAKVPLYTSVELIRRHGAEWYKKGKGKGRKGKGGRSRDDDDDDDDVSDDEGKWYIKFSGDQKEKSAVYTKGDLWIISPAPQFDSPAQTFVVRSNWHGISSQNQLEVEFVGPYPQGRSPKPCTGLSALRGPDAGLQFDKLEMLKGPQSDALRKLPLLPILLGRVDRPEAGVAPKLQPLLEKVCGEFGLNPDQQEVLTRSLQWCSAPQEPRAVLVHGPFGSGKTHTLVALILLLLEAFDALGMKEARILVAAGTNVAVDRILHGLADRGLTDLARIGSFRKILKSLLPYTVHSLEMERTESKDAINELNEMLRGPLSAGDRKSVTQALEEAKSGAMKARAKALRKRKVVGVTCAAASKTVLGGHKFDVVLLDESSQLTEPTSLLPIARFSCRCLVAMGDPKQLPPIVEGMGAGDTTESLSKGAAKTLFSRLARTNRPPVLLRTQFRCHPAISGLANANFYDNQLLDGIAESARPSVFEGLPPVCFYDVQGGVEVSGHGGSYYNMAEAQQVVKMVAQLVGNGLGVDDIGVICLYRAQQYKIADMIEQQATLAGVKVSTVDAFQGEERKVILLSTVRTQGGSEHLGCPYRTNVAITRAMCNLVILGNRNTLCQKSGVWRSVLETVPLISGDEGAAPSGPPAPTREMQEWEQEQAMHGQAGYLEDDLVLEDDAFLADEEAEMELGWEPM